MGNCENYCSFYHIQECKNSIQMIVSHTCHDVSKKRLYCHDAYRRLKFQKRKVTSQFPFSYETECHTNSLSNSQHIRLPQKSSKIHCCPTGFIVSSQSSVDAAFNALILDDTHAHWPVWLAGFINGRNDVLFFAVCCALSYFHLQDLTVPASSFAQTQHARCQKMWYAKFGTATPIITH